MKAIIYILLLCSVFEGYTQETFCSFNKKSFRQTDDEVIFFKTQNLNGNVDIDNQLFNIEILNTNSTFNSLPDFIGGVFASHTMDRVKLSPNQTLSPGRHFSDNGNSLKTPFVIKGPKSSPIVVVIPTNTYEAYNDWGDASLYTIHNGFQLTNSVSFNRPMNYDHALIYDTPFLYWIKTQDYQINYIADEDLDDYSEISQASVIIIIGHNEYWTRRARYNFDKFIHNGGNAIILSGNTMCWQTRYEGVEDPFNFENRRMVCYRGIGNLYLGSFDEIADCYPEYETNYWLNSNVNASTNGSIGIDYIHNCYGNIDQCNGSFGGFKIQHENSPIVTNLSNSAGQASSLSHNEVLRLNTDEFDRTLIKTDDENNPILDAEYNLQFDQNAMGFYKMELVGYDRTSSEANDGIYRYAPFAVMQPQCNSGKIIIAASTDWCGIRGFLNTMPNGDPIEKNIDQCNQQSTTVHAYERKIITKNMIDLLLNNQNVFQILIYPMP